MIKKENNNKQAEKSDRMPRSVFLIIVFSHHSLLTNPDILGLSDVTGTFKVVKKMDDVGNR
jgi:hypothetical protein